MRTSTLCLMVAMGFAWCPVNAATITITNNIGGNELVLGPNESGEIQIRVTTTSIDTVGLAYLNAFLDTTGNGVDADSVDVTAVEAGNGPPWIYDRPFELPAELDAPGNEYGLFSGDHTSNTGGYPLGSETYVHDILYVINTNESDAGSIFVTFELGARAPNAFGPGPLYESFILAPPGFPEGFPNFLYVGDANSTNPPFVFTIIGETEPPVLLGAASWADHEELGPLAIDIALEGAVTSEPRLAAGGQIEMFFTGALDPEVVEDPSNIDVQRATGGTIDAEDMLLELDDSGQVLTLSFPGLPGGLLADQDRYTIDLSAFVPEGDADFDLRVLVGDVNEDGTVDPLDFGAILSRYAEDVSVQPWYDVNNDAFLDPLDSGAVQARYGNSAP